MPSRLTLILTGTLLIFGLLGAACTGRVATPHLDETPPGSQHGTDAGDTELDAMLGDDSGVADDTGVAEDTGVTDDVAPTDGDADTTSDGGDTTGPDVTDSAPDVGEPDIDEPDVNVPPPEPFYLYLAPNGSDARDGRTPGTAILTLARAHEILVAEKPERDVVVQIAPGRYFGQTVDWRYTMPEHTITFTRPNSQSERPVFDGCLVANPTNTRTQCPGGTWFTLRHSAGTPTNLVFNYLRVERYQTAISFNGARNAEATHNSHNTIYGCYFDKIGNGFAPHLADSTAAVRLVNSKDNRIENNHLVNIINTNSPLIIHAIYAAHLSHRNTIARNRFVNNSGDAVRLRDYSNDNVITNNTFIRAGDAAGYTDWYCRHEDRPDCTKRDGSGNPLAECPSWGNAFRDNVLDGNYRCDPLGVWHYFQPDVAWGCSPPTPDARRVRTSGNTRPTPPCSTQ